MFEARRENISILMIIFVFTLFLFICPISFTTHHTYALSSETVHSATENRTEAEGHGGDRKGDLMDLLFRFVNFALLVIILFIVIKKTPLKHILSTRSEEIHRKLEDLRYEKEEAEKKYLEIEKQLNDFGNKRKDIMDQFRKEGLIEKEKIVSEAKQRVQQIISQSEIAIQQEIQIARERLKKQVVDLAAQKAQEIITKEIDEKDQDQLVSDFLERVGKIH